MIFIFQNIYNRSKSMILFLLIIVLLASEAFGQNKYTNCDYFQQINAGGSADVFSTGYAQNINYTPGTNCRWKAVAPPGYKISVNCGNLNLPPSFNCNGDKILISYTGNSDLTDAQSYCNNQPFTASSTSNQIVIALQSTIYSPGGQFLCHLTTVAPTTTTTKAPSSNQFSKCDYFQQMTVGATYSIYSPGYNKNYSPGTNCRWRAVAPSGYTIVLNCANVQLPPSYNCNGDKILVSYSGKRNLTDAQTYCQPFSGVSYSNTIIVALLTATFTSGGNFLCTISTTQSTKPVTPQPPPGVYTNCDYFQQLSVGNSYYIYSSGYAQNQKYTPGTNCRWRAAVPVGYTININCMVVNLPQSPNCSGDKLAVSYSGNSLLSDAQIYCQPFSGTSYTNQIVIALLTTSFSTGGQFLCQLSTTGTSTPPPTLPPPPSPTNFANCDYFQQMTAGQSYYIYSTGYATNQPYRPGTNCRWRAVAPPGLAITINCMVVNLPQSNNCNGDKIEVSYSGNMALSDAQTYCHPFSVSSYSSQIVIALLTTVYSTGGQFLCQLSTLGPRNQAISPTIAVSGKFSKCDYFQQMDVGKTYNVFSTGYADNQNYKPGTNCRWRAVAPTGYKINVNCEKIIVPPSQNCNGDSIKISYTGNMNLNDAKSYCTNRPFSAVSVTNQVVIAQLSTIYSTGGKFLCKLTTKVSPVQPTSPPRPPPPPINPSYCDCGRRKTSRIVGGTTTGVNEFPMMAGLVQLPYATVFCGATILTNFYALTSAHCLSKKTAQSMRLLVGEHDYKSGNDTTYAAIYPISTLIPHQQYNQYTYVNDIALVKTQRSIIFNIAVGPVCLPFKFAQQNNMLAGSTVEGVGWGMLSFGGPDSSTLQKVQLKVISNIQCQQNINTKVSFSQICTLTPKKDTCQMDSGGPLFYTLNGIVFQAGIVSYGQGCATNFAAVSTRVSSFLNWIESNTPGATYCTK